MKIGMIILGVIGALIALTGSIVTMIGGVGGTTVGVLADNSVAASSGAFVFWSGAAAIGISVLGLIFAVAGGSAKQKNTILIFSFAALIAGLLNIYLYNWFSGAIIAAGGALGMAGAKDGAQTAQRLVKSPLFYLAAVMLLAMAGASVVIKNGRDFVESASAAAMAATPDPVETAVEPAPDAAAPIVTLPFAGSQSFNFEGGSGTGKTITALPNGHVRVESLGTRGKSVDYEGRFTNPLRISAGHGLLFKGNKVFLTDGRTITKDCREPGQDCVSDLTPAEETPAPLAPNLKEALADTNAITCRYNEAEGMCGELDGSGENDAPPQEFAARKGYPAIITQQTFDEPGTTDTYLKMRIKN